MVDDVAAETGDATPEELALLEELRNTITLEVAERFVAQPRVLV
jgi:hypothetical protein